MFLRSQGRMRRSLKGMVTMNPREGRKQQFLHRRTARRWASRASTATIIHPIVVNNGPQLELKFHDVDLNDATIAAGVNVTPSINLIAQGTGESQRIGRKVTIKQIGWRFQLLLPGQADITTSTETVRVIMYLDKQANKLTAAATDILETANFQSFNNLSNRKRFRTLMDRVYTLNTGVGAGDGTANDTGPTAIDDTFFKKVNIPLEFNAAAGALSEITSNNIGVLLIGLNGTAAFDSKIRLRYTDI